MRHWYLLIESRSKPDQRHCASDAAIVAGRERDPCDGLSPAQRTKMFWLGLVEAIPFVTGGIFAAFSDTVASAAGWAAAALATTAFVCWCLRHQTPDTRIEFSSSAADTSKRKREATQEV
jgi:hypothetical protein